MRRYLTLSIIIFVVSVFLIVGCKNKEASNTETADVQVSNSTADTTKDYEEFFKKFENNESYQLSHIKFPIKYVSESPDGSENKEIKKSEYKYSNAFKEDIKCEYKKINDNEFNAEVRGVESGIAVDYLFNKFDNEWYLVKIIDYSN